MQVSLNGDATEIGDGFTVAGLLGHLGIGRERVAVEVNLDIVLKADYDSKVLAAGDRIEIVHFVGGGGVAQDSSTKNLAHYGAR